MLREISLRTCSLLTSVLSFVIALEANWVEEVERGVFESFFCVMDYISSAFFVLLIVRNAEHYSTFDSVRLNGNKFATN